MMLKEQKIWTVSGSSDWVQQPHYSSLPITRFIIIIIYDNIIMVLVICRLLLYMCCYCHCIECYTFRMYNNIICKIALITILPLRICESYVSVHVRECVYVCTCPRVQT